MHVIPSPPLSLSLSLSLRHGGAGVGALSGLTTRHTPPRPHCPASQSAAPRPSRSGRPWRRSVPAVRCDGLTLDRPETSGDSLSAEDMVTQAGVQEHSALPRKHFQRLKEIISRVHKSASSVNSAELLLICHWKSQSILKNPCGL
ncbi:hypothetical protein E2C01_074030 [Portunus trituberculatus]|uniref:Uncharacterized protein n=1 Tax=Portunus trituberculatus TaxID=210409 RepID=A0A5B7I2B6_PORTR|nr:hypothetical protein [Portunus trituberculatus]